MSEQRRNLLWSVSPVLVFVIFAVFLFIQYQTVFLGHDDYGHASLSYLIEEPDVAGDQFTPSQVWHIAMEAYNIVDPRIGVFLIDPWFYRAGLDVTRIVAVILVFCLFFLMYRLALITDNGVNSVKSNRKAPFIMAVLSASMFGIYTLETYRVGFYWFTACFGYLIPLTVFLLAFLLYCRWSRYNALHLTALALMFFYSSFSQENIYFLVFSSLVFLTIFDLIDHRKLILKNIICIAASLCGIVLQFIAPSNAARVGGIYSEGILSHIGHRYTEAIPYLFGPYNTIFVSVLLLFAIVVSFLLWKRKNKGMALLLGLPSMILLALTAVRISSAFSIFGEGNIAVVIISVYLVIFVVGLSMHYWKNRLSFALFWGSILSMAPCLVAPYIVPRQFIPLQIIISILFTRELTSVMLSETSGRIFNMLGVFVLCALVLTASVNLGLIYRGYRANAPYMAYNDAELRRVHSLLEDGEIIKEVTLYKNNKNGRFAPNQPWWGDGDGIEYWMKQYYDLPEDMVFKYRKQTVKKHRTLEDVFTQ
jgi:hypothetical protein